MKEIVIACETLRDEIQAAINITGYEQDIRWIKSGLHNIPEKLRSCLQQQLDQCNEYDRVLMTFGLCGNSIIGLNTGDFQLVIPKVDDCISLLLGSVSERVKAGKDGGVYFLTPGWLRGERNIWAEYNYAVEKYGEKKGDMIMKLLLENYKYLGMLDTKAYNMNEYTYTVDKIAKKLGLSRKIIPASVDYLCQLLTGPWQNDKFVVLEPHSQVTGFSVY